MADDKHEIVCDIRAVARQLGRPPKRDEYLSASKNFSRKKIDRVFGSWTGAILACGFTSSRDKKDPFGKRIDKYDVNRKIERRFRSEIKPYAGKFDRKQKGDLLIVSMSDAHSQWVDPFAFDVFLDTLKRASPTHVILGGDILDFFEISRFDKDPTRIHKLQDEIDFTTQKMFGPIREAAPNAQIDLILGNHEWRLFKFLCAYPALSSLRCLRFDRLLHLDTWEINLVARESFLTSKSDKQVKNFKLYNDCWVFTHGTAGGEHPGAKEMRRYGYSGASGHVHRHTVVTQTDLRAQKVWVTLPCMAQIKHGEEYIWDIVPWQNGFLITHITKSKKISNEPAIIHNGFTSVGGVTYEKDKY